MAVAPYDLDRKQASSSEAPTESFRCFVSAWHIYRPKTSTHLLDYWCPWRPTPRFRHEGRPGNLLEPGRSVGHRQAVLAIEAEDGDDALRKAALAVCDGVPKGWRLAEYEIQLLEDDQDEVIVTGWLSLPSIVTVGRDS